MPKAIKTTFEGHEALEIKTGKARMVIITDCGPRIAFFGKPKGKNLLFWDTENRARGDWKLHGGHRVWVARPGADEAEETYLPDNQPCDIEERNGILMVIGQKDPILKIRKGIGFKIEAPNKIDVGNFIVNESDMLFSCSVWSLTCMSYAKGRTYGIPVGDGSHWDCFKYVMFRQWGGGHTSRFNDPQIKFTEDMLILTPQGKETKRMIEAHRGILAMNAPDQKTTFITKSPYKKGAAYPAGCNTSFYVGPKNFMVELEFMSPETTLKPFEETISMETWVLTDKAIGLDPEKLNEAIR
jgi:hypothetical protein